MGLVGFVLLAAFVGSFLVAAIRTRRRRGALDAPLAAGVVAACVAWLFHAAVDWDWQVTAMSGLAILLAATLYPRRQEAVRRKREPEGPSEEGPHLLTADELREKARRAVESRGSPAAQ